MGIRLFSATEKRDYYGKEFIKIKGHEITSLCGATTAKKLRVFINYREVVVYHEACKVVEILEDNCGVKISTNFCYIPDSPCVTKGAFEEIENCARWYVIEVNKLFGIIEDESPW